MVSAAHRPPRTAVVGFLLWTTFAPPAVSQSDLASLSGQVLDETGGAVVSARTCIRSLGTGFERCLVTDSQGRYGFPLILPGRYELEIEASGFHLFRDATVLLRVGQSSTSDVRLALAHLSQALDVEGSLSLLNSQNAAQGTVVNSRQIAALPLNGRQFVHLALLVPEANPGGRNVQQNILRPGQLGGLSVSGGRTNNNSFLFDGIIDTDPDYNALSYVPIADAVAEFLVQTSLFGVEAGHASGGQINIITRSGTNQMHVRVWEFLRNTVFDARPFNLPTGQATFQRSQFGALLAGPIITNRVFGLLAYEGLRSQQAAAGLTTVTVPTQRQRAGDFRDTAAGIYDPATLSAGVRQQFPENAIPQSRLNPLARAAISALPLPNVDGTSLLVNSAELLRQTNENWTARMDCMLASRGFFFGRFSLANEAAKIPDVLPTRTNFSAAGPQNGVVASTMTLGPSLVHEIRFGFNRLRFAGGLPEPAFDLNGHDGALPRFLIARYPAIGGAGGFLGTTGGGTFLVRDNSFQLYTNLLWHKGRQAVKLGGEIVRLQYNRFESPNVLGTYQFTEGFTTRTASNDGTGHPLASFLLGLPSVASRSIGPGRIDGRQSQYSLYAQADLRARPGLTLNFGLRYELATPLYDHRYQMANIDFSSVPPAKTIFEHGRTAVYAPTLYVCGRGGYPRGCVHRDYNNLAPRVGLAWTPTGGRTVVRAGAGIFYALTDANPLYRLAAGLPYNIAQTFSSDNFIPSLSGLSVFDPAVVGPSQVQAAALDVNQRTSYSIQWAASIQKQVAGAAIIELGYVATLGLKLEQNIQVNNAQPGAGPVDPR